MAASFFILRVNILKKVNNKNKRKMEQFCDKLRKMENLIL
jgi:hypothetical protein